jgi:hypothetical protein
MFVSRIATQLNPGDKNKEEYKCGPPTKIRMSKKCTEVGN